MTRTHGAAVRVIQAISLFAALAVAVPVAAQIGAEPGVWTAVSVQGGVGAQSPWRWGADSLVRTRDGTGTMDFVAEWVSATRELTPRSAAGIGYAYGASFPDAGPVREHRVVQQYTWSSDGARRVSFRTRLEERFISENDRMLVRVRQQVRGSWPLAARGTLRGVVSGELFVNANSTALASRGFDGNRLSAGIARKMTARSGMEVGYVHVYRAHASGPVRHSHVMSATLFVSL